MYMDLLALTMLTTYLRHIYAVELLYVLMHIYPAEQLNGNDWKVEQ